MWLKIRDFLARTWPKVVAFWESLPPFWQGVAYGFWAGAITTFMYRFL